MASIIDLLPARAPTGTSAAEAAALKAYHDALQAMLRAAHSVDAELYCIEHRLRPFADDQIRLRTRVTLRHGDEPVDASDGTITGTLYEMAEATMVAGIEQVEISIGFEAPGDLDEGGRERYDLAIGEARHVAEGLRSAQDEFASAREVVAARSEDVDLHLLLGGAA
ncbi:MAG: hypothetical protein P8R42_12490 [Candidatus Binatia bacterium]|nr:hypothetical protein [Candidatus Binatia bacterium]